MTSSWCTRPMRRWSAGRTARRTSSCCSSASRRRLAGNAGFDGMRCLGIDYGTRRIGLSYGDELGVATPLPALVESDPAKRWAALAAVLQQRKVTEIVAGHPLNMDDTAGPKAKEAEAFAARLREEFKLPVHLVDERLTSYEAEESIPKE